MAGRRSLLEPVGRDEKPLFWPMADVPHWRRFRPMVLMLIGRRNQGKTLAMTALASAMLKRYKKMGAAHRKVAANYHVSFAEWQSPYIVDEMALFPDWARDLLLLVDEATSLFNSRRAMSKVNVNFSNFLMQIRKRGVEVLFTTQFPQSVDYMLLLQVDLFLQCELVDNGRGVTLYAHDYWGQWTGKDYRKPFPPHRDAHDWSFTLYNTDTMFSQYNTEEVVAPVWTPGRDAINEAEGWRFEDQTDESAATPDPEQRLVELFKSFGPAFNPAPHLGTVKTLLPDQVSNRKEYNAWLTAQGWKITRGVDNSSTAERVE